MTTNTGTEVRSGLNCPVALVLGAVSVVLGVAGFLLSGAVGPVGGPPLAEFRVSMLYNVLHLGVGAALVAAGILGARPARLVNTAVGLGYLALVLVGLVAAGAPPDPFALNGPDHGLHLVLALPLLAVGLGVDRAPH